MYSLLIPLLDWTCVARLRPSVRPDLEGETPTNESSGGETSTCMGRNVKGAKRPGSETSTCNGRIVQGANRPEGESSRGRNVQEAKRPGRGRNVLGAKRRGGEMSSYRYNLLMHNWPVNVVNI